MQAESQLNAMVVPSDAAVQRWKSKVRIVSAADWSEEIPDIYFRAMPKFVAEF